MPGYAYALLAVIGGLIAIMIGIMLWSPVASYLVGGYWRTGSMGRMYFLTRRGAERYGHHGLSAIDPYVRGLRGPIVFQSGRLTRRWPRRVDHPRPSWRGGLSFPSPEG